MPPVNKGSEKRTGPTPVNILLKAVQRAVDAGVDRTKIVTMMDLAITATEPTSDGSAKQQAGTFRQVSGTLNKWSDAEGNGVQPG